jgi:hydrogenase nickel incorporation protein HypA/HybF
MGRRPTVHELSIALSILDVAGEEASRHGGRVAAVHLRLGPLAGVVKESLTSAFEMAREGTALEQAQLIVEEVPVVAFCPGCAVEHTLPAFAPLCCPVCGDPTPEVVHGREMEVVALEIDS